jgi:hypothetical protein
LQNPTKFTQIWIFGLKTNHLATLVGSPTEKVAFADKASFPSVDLGTKIALIEDLFTG